MEQQEVEPRRSPRIQLPPFPDLDGIRGYLLRSPTFAGLERSFRTLGEFVDAYDNKRDYYISTYQRDVLRAANVRFGREIISERSIRYDSAGTIETHHAVLFCDLVLEDGRITNTGIAIDLIEIRSIGLFPS
jgi:hypothetical protein